MGTAPTTWSAATVETPLGPFTVVVDGPALRIAGFTANVDHLASYLDDGPLQFGEGPADAARAAASAVERYFAGEYAALGEVALAWQAEGFRDRVWQAMAAVPPGETISYGELAVRAGAPAGAYEANRAAGQACARNPLTLFLPCHRIVAANGALHNYGWGLGIKRWLIDHESNQGRLF